MSDLLLHRNITIGIPQSDVEFPRIKSIVPNILTTAGGVIRITFSAGDSTAGITAARVTADGVAAQSVSIISVTEVDVTFGALSNGQKTIQTISNAGTAIAEESITVQDISAPNAPVLRGYTSGKYANLSWTMAGGSNTYEIDGDISLSGLTGQSINIAMPRANREYRFRVRGVSVIAGNGAWSTAITVKTEQVADDETIALAGSAVLSSIEDLTGTLHIAQGMTGAKIFDPIILPSAISQETFEYYVKDVLYNQGRNVL